MIVNLTDELKNLKISLHLSLDSVTIGHQRITAANSVNVTAKPGGKFDVDIDATTCKVWAKWFAVTGAGTIAIAANPFENDGGHLFIDARDAPIPVTEITPNLNGNDTVIVVIWSLDTGAGGFGPTRDGRAVVCSSSSSSSSSNSSSSNSSTLNSSSSSISPLPSSSSSNSSSSISSGSMSSSSSIVPSSSSSTSSRSSGSSPMSSSSLITRGKSNR